MIRAIFDLADPTKIASEPSVQWASAAVRIASDQLSVIDMTRELGCPPTRSVEKGMNRGRDARRQTYSESVWLFESGLSASEPLDCHLADVGNFVEAHSVAMLALSGGCYFSIMIACAGPEYADFAISADTLSKLSVVPMALWVDLFPPEGEPRGDAVSSRLDRPSLIARQLERKTSDVQMAITRAKQMSVPHFMGGDQVPYDDTSRRWAYAELTDKHSASSLHGADTSADDLGDQIRALLASVPKHAQNRNLEIRGVYGSENGQGGFVLGPDEIALVSKLGVDLSITLIVNGKE